MRHLETTKRAARLDRVLAASAPKAWPQGWDCTVQSHPTLGDPNLVHALVSPLCPGQSTLWKMGGFAFSFPSSLLDHTNLGDHCWTASCCPTLPWNLALDKDKEVRRDSLSHASSLFLFHLLQGFTHIQAMPGTILGTLVWVYLMWGYGRSII